MLAFVSRPSPFGPMGFSCVCNRTHIRSEKRWVHIITPPVEPKAHEITDDPRAPSSLPH